MQPANCCLVARSRITKIQLNVWGLNARHKNTRKKNLIDISFDAAMQPADGELDGWPSHCSSPVVPHPESRQQTCQYFIHYVACRARTPPKVRLKAILCSFLS